VNDAPRRARCGSISRGSTRYGYIWIVSTCSPPRRERADANSRRAHYVGSWTCGRDVEQSAFPGGLYGCSPRCHGGLRFWRYPARHRCDAPARESIRSNTPRSAPSRGSPTSSRSAAPPRGPPALPLRARGFNTKPPQPDPNCRAPFERSSRSAARTQAIDERSLRLRLIPPGEPQAARRAPAVPVVERGRRPVGRPREAAAARYPIVGASTEPWPGLVAVVGDPDTTPGSCFHGVPSHRPGSGAPAGVPSRRGAGE